MSPSRDSGASNSSLSVQIVGASVEARAMENLLQSQPGINVVAGGAQIVLILGRDGLAALQRRRLRTPRRAKEQFVLLTNGREIDFRLARELPIRAMIGVDEAFSIFLQGLHEVAEGKSFCSPQMVPVLLSATSGSVISSESSNRPVESTRTSMAPKPKAVVEEPQAPSQSYTERVKQHVNRSVSPASAPSTAIKSGDNSDAIRRVMNMGLSDREAEIAVATGNGLSNQEIAEQFSVSLATVKFHLYRIYQKLGINRRSQLAQLTSGAKVLTSV